VKRKPLRAVQANDEKGMVTRIPPLLRARLDELKGTELEMPAERALGMQALFDRVLVWQFPDDAHASETFGGGKILKPESTKVRHRQSVPRGLVISVGLGALDALRANGVDVGHIVQFCVNSTYRLPLDDNDVNHLCLLRAGDLVASEDLARALDIGECVIVEVDGVHVFRDKSGKEWKPRLPWMEE
jgi:hypothetical protein